MRMIQMGRVTTTMRNRILVLPLLLWLSTSTAHAGYYEECQRHLTAADADGNGSLSPVELSDAVERITYGAVTTLSLPGTALLLNTAETTLCEAIYKGILSSLDVRINTVQCFLFMTIGDNRGTRNNQLEQDEFPRFTASLSQTLKQGSQPLVFTELQTPLQAVYEEFVDSTTTAGIDITGTRPGTQPTATRLPVLTSLCQQTAVAVVASNHLQEQQQQQEVVVTTPAAGPSVDTVTVELRFCTTALLAADRDRDLQLDETEYTRALGTLTRRVVPEASIPTAAYDDLPTALKDNFVVHAATADTWTIHRPPFTPAQETAVQTLCDDTVAAIVTAVRAANDDKGNQPTAPTGPPPVETFPYTQCTLSMATADRNRDNRLDTAEYIQFLNKVASNTWRGVTFDDLPAPLRDSYLVLGGDSGDDDDGGVDVTGAFPSGTPPTDDQRAHLERICEDTAQAVHQTRYPEAYIDDDDDDGIYNNATTRFTGSVTVYTAFVLSTTFTDETTGTNASDVDGVMNTTTTRTTTTTTTSLADVLAQNGTALEDAYEGFVQQSVTLYSSETGQTGGYGVMEDSVILYAFQSATTGECENDDDDCQIAYGSFNLTVVNYPGEEVWVMGNVTDFVQDRLNVTTAGSLQSFLVSAFAPDPSPLLIMRIPVDGHVQPPDVRSESEEQESKSNSDKGGIGAGLIVGIVLIILFCGSCGILVYCFGDLPSKICNIRKERSKPMDPENGPQPGYTDDDDNGGRPKFTGAPAGYDDDEDGAAAAADDFPKRRPVRRASIFMHGDPEDSERGGGDNIEFDLSDRPEQPQDDDDDPFRKRGRRMAYGGDDDYDDDYGSEASGSEASGSGYGDSDSGGSYGDDGYGYG